MLGLGLVLRLLLALLFVYDLRRLGKMLRTMLLKCHRVPVFTAHSWPRGVGDGEMCRPRFLRCSKRQGKTKKGCNADADADFCAEIDGVSSWQGGLALQAGNWMAACAREGFLGSGCAELGELLEVEVALEPELFAGGNAGFYAGGKEFHLLFSDWSWSWIGMSPSSLRYFCTGRLCDQAGG